MFRPLYGHHQAYHLNHVIKTLHTLLGSQLRLQNFEMTSRLRIFIQIKTLNKSLKMKDRNWVYE